MLQIAISCRAEPHLFFEDSVTFERRMGRVMLRIIAASGIFLRPWTPIALLELALWIAMVQHALSHKGNRGIIRLFKSLCFRRGLSACAFVALQVLTLIRFFPPAIIPLALLGLLLGDLGPACLVLACLSIPGITVDVPVVEFAVLFGLLIPLWLYGLWIPRWKRTIPLFILYWLELGALGYEVWVRWVGRGWW